MCCLACMYFISFCHITSSLILDCNLSLRLPIQACRTGSSLKQVASWEHANIKFTTLNQTEEARGSQEPVPQELEDQATVAQESQGQQAVPTSHVYSYVPWYHKLEPAKCHNLLIIKKWSSRSNHQELIYKKWSSRSDLQEVISKKWSSRSNFQEVFFKK